MAKPPPPKPQGEILLHGGIFTAVQNTVVAHAAELSSASAYSYAFWLQPTGSQGAWSNLLHKGATDRERGPAIWFYPGSTRLHVRSASSADWNAGCDPTEALPVGTWTHVALMHDNTGIKVWLNANLAGQANLPPPALNGGPLYVSNPWYAAGKASLGTLYYFPRSVTQAEIAALVRKRHP